jgi:uncharacterized protein YjeT (DUF2065 family)
MRENVGSADRETGALPGSVTFSAVPAAWRDIVMVTTSLPTRQLGATGATVPVLGYGTAPLGQPDVSREHAERCLNHAIDRGVTYLDTSPDYGSEPHVGAVMRSRRDEVSSPPRSTGAAATARWAN